MIEKIRARLRAFIVSGAAPLLTASAIFSQAVSTVQISGVVQDATGAAIQGARITITHNLTGLTRTATTGPEGGYVIPQLPVGPYQLVAEQKVFGTVVQRGIEPQVGDNQHRRETSWLQQASRRNSRDN